MDTKDKKTIFESLQKCENLIKENMASVGNPSEAEVRSINNEKLTVCLDTFGEHVADVQNMVQVKKDHLEQLYEAEKLRYMKEIEDGKKMPANKAESLVKTDIEYMSELSSLRDLEKSENVLKRKEKSMWATLDHSRSRFSKVNKDRA